MSPLSKVNKENFRLLDLSSDEESEDLQLEVIPSRKKKVTRRERSRAPPPRAAEPNFAAEVKCALQWAVRGTLLLWLLMLTWICAALSDQVSVMKSDFAQVSTSTGGVSASLQLCHTTARELKNNTSQLTERLELLEKQHKELASKVEQATGELSTISGQLAQAPNLADTPRRVANLQQTVANLGSQIRGFEGTLNSAQKQAITATSGLEELKTLLHQLDSRTNETIANMSTNAKKEEDISNQLTVLNNTLVSNVEAIHNRVEEIMKTVSTATPAAVTQATSTTTLAGNTTTSSTTTQPPDPPLKPNLLQ